MSRVVRLAALGCLFAAIAYLIPHPAGVTPQGWRQMAILVCVIVGMILEPLPASALVLFGLTAMVANGTPMREALGGFAEPSDTSPTSPRRSSGSRVRPWRRGGFRSACASISDETARQRIPLLCPPLP
jgi:hypothetical protein